MIRKVLSLLLTTSMLLSFAACTNGAIEPSPPASPMQSDDVTASVSPSAEPSSEPSSGQESPDVSATPEPSPSPSQTPSATPEPSASPETSASPEPSPSAEPEGVTCASIWSSITSQSTQLPAFMQATSDDLLAMYGIDASILDDFCLNVPMMIVSATEIFIAKVDSDNMETVKSGIAARKQNLLDQWSTYLPDQYDLVDSAKVVTSGDYILFVIAEDTDSIVNIFNAALSA